MTFLSYFDFVVVDFFFQASIRDHDYCGEKRYMVQNTIRSATALPKYTCGKLSYTQQTRFGMTLLYTTTIIIVPTSYYMNIR